eukprot:307631-Pleurochrysis_carterae.AAC.1
MFEFQICECTLHQLRTKGCGGFRNTALVKVVVAQAVSTTTFSTRRRLRCCANDNESDVLRSTAALRRCEDNEVSGAVKAATSAALSNPRRWRCEGSDDASAALAASNNDAVKTATMAL